MRQVTVAAVMLILALAASEIGLRLAGFQPIRISSVPSTRSSSVRPYLTAHPTLGYTLLPGSWQGSQHVGSWNRTYRVTADANGRRITHAPRGTGEPARDHIWIFGCSVTFGALLNDDETYPWIVQELLPEYEIVNFGLGSYSTLHSLIQLEEALQQPVRPKVVVLAYNSFHDQRNVFSRGWRQSIRGGFRRPFARFGPDGQLHRGMMDESYDVLPLAQSSVLVAVIDRALSRFDERRLRAREASRLLIGDMLALCRREGIQFVIVNLSNDVSDLLAYFRRQGAATVITPLARTGMTFVPYDPHPNPAGARHIAEKLAPFLRQLSNRRSS